jgi:hypothetical protein
MNIESEVKSILGCDLLQLDTKIKLITNFTNFKKEDISEAVKRKYGYKADVIYKELINLDRR